MTRTITNPAAYRNRIVASLNSRLATKLEAKKEELRKKFFVVEATALDVLKGVVGDKGRKPIKFKSGQQLTIDLQTANMLLTVYNALSKDELKQKFEKMLSDSPSSFMRLVDFGWKQVK